MTSFPYVEHVPTIAALRRTRPTSTRRVVVVEGGVASNDGGGGVFLWAPASTATDDGSTIVALTTLVDVGQPGRWVLLERAIAATVTLTGDLTGTSDANTLASAIATAITWSGAQSFTGGATFTGVSNFAGGRAQCTTIAHGATKVMSATEFSVAVSGGSGTANVTLPAPTLGPNGERPMALVYDDDDTASANPIVLHVPSGSMKGPDVVANTLTISENGGSATLVGDGTNWRQL